MKDTIVICNNKSCPNWKNGGCSRTFVSIEAGGKCLSAEQEGGKKVDEILSRETVMMEKT